MRQVIVLSVALFIALVASYVTWTDEGEEFDDTEVAMYRAESPDISMISWESKASTTTITRKSDANGDYFEVDSVVRKEKQVPTAVPKDELEDEDGEDAEPEGEEAEGEDAEGEDAEAEGEDGEEEPEMVPTVKIEVEETKSQFLGSDAAFALWESFAPLMAMRELEVNDDTDTTVFGLEEPKATIQVQRGDKLLELTVGAETFGSKDLYVGYADRVFLVENKVLQPLEFAAQRLIERALHPVSERDATKLTLTWPDKTERTWTHEERAPQSDNPNAKPTQVWLDDGETPKADDTAATWIDKLLRLRLREYLTPDAEQALVLTPVFEVELAEEDDKTWSIEVFKSEEDGETSWYAKSDFNRGTVLLTASLARSVAEDLGNLRK